MNEAGTSTKVRVALRVLGETLEVEGQVPADAIRLDEALPFFRNLEDGVLEVAVRRAQGEGKVISCQKGCAACCKAQPVPITPPEAYALAALVESLPADRRDEIRRRIADRVERLRASGLLDSLLHRQAALSKEEARAIAERYFRLGLACPFLDNDSCTIYEERPFVCRQYMVTSPAALCQDPFHHPVQPLPVPIAAAGAMLRVSEKMLKRPQVTVPLVLALEYVTTHRQELEQTFDARDIHQSWLQALAQADS